MSEHPNGAGEWFRSLFGKKEKDDSYYHRRPASGFSGIRSHRAARTAGDEVPPEAEAVREAVPQGPAEPAPVPAQEPVPVQEPVPAQEPVSPVPAPESVEAPAEPAPAPEAAPAAAQISLDLPEEVVGENWPREVLSVARDPGEWDAEEEAPSGIPSSEGQISLDIGPEEVPAAPAAEPVPEEPAPVRYEPQAPLTTEELETPRAPVPPRWTCAAPFPPATCPPRRKRRISRNRKTPPSRKNRPAAAAPWAVS